MVSADKAVRKCLKAADMKKLFNSFLRDEPGAGTVDFVVFVAAICTLGLVVVVIISGGATDLANDIENFLGNVEV